MISFMRIPGYHRYQRKCRFDFGCIATGRVRVRVLRNIPDNSFLSGSDNGVVFR